MNKFKLGTYQSIHKSLGNKLPKWDIRFSDHEFKEWLSEQPRGDMSKGGGGLIFDLGENNVVHYSGD